MTLVTVDVATPAALATSFIVVRILYFLAYVSSNVGSQVSFTVTFEACFKIDHTKTNTNKIFWA